jgi:hypothetical protein
MIVADDPAALARSSVGWFSQSDRHNPTESKPVLVMKYSSALVLVGVALLSLPLPVSANSGRAHQKQRLLESANAVIGVELVTTFAIPRPQIPNSETRAPIPRSRPRDVQGVVISPAGLTVVPLSQIQPTAATPAGDKVEMAEPTFRDIKLRLPNGREVAATLKLKLPQYDLAFLAPESSEGPAERFECVNLQRLAKAEVLADYYEIGRTPKALHNASLIRSASVVSTATVEECILVSFVSTGTAIVDAEGLFLGIATRPAVLGQTQVSGVIPGHVLARYAAELGAQKIAVAIDPVTARSLVNDR